MPRYPQWTLRFWFSEALASTSTTLASSATCLHQIHACCPTPPKPWEHPLGSYLPSLGAHSLPARTRTQPAGGPHVVQRRFPAGGAQVKGPEVDLGRECKASRLLCRWRTQDSAVVSWEALRHPAAVRRNNRPSYQDFSCISSASAPASALLCGSGQISPRDLKPCMQVTSGFPFYHMLENYKYYLHLDTGSTLIWKWSLENTDFQNTKHQKNLWASLKPASADLILCFFSHTLFTFCRFAVGWRDSLNSFQHFMKLVPLFTCVQCNTYMWDSCRIYTLFVCVWHVYCIYNSHFYLKLGLRLKYIHAHTSSPGVFHKEIKNIVDWFISDPLAY